MSKAGRKESLDLSDIEVRKCLQLKKNIPGWKKKPLPFDVWLLQRMPAQEQALLQGKQAAWGQPGCKRQPGYKETSFIAHVDTTLSS